MKQSGDWRVRGQGVALGIGVLVTLLVALSIAPIALGGAALWFLWRLASYASGTVVEGEIVGWRHERQADHPTASMAYARLRFADADGQTRTVTASVGTPTDAALAHIDPLPEGGVRLRYRRFPFLALEDDPSVWLTGPAILLATAVLGTMLKLLFRFSPLAWIMGT